jgi:hypothetical protein
LRQILGKGVYKTTTGGVVGEASWTQQTQSPLPVNTASFVHFGGPLRWVSSDGGGHFVKVPTTENDRQPASPHGDYVDGAPLVGSDAVTSSGFYHQCAVSARCTL